MFWVGVHGLYVHYGVYGVYGYVWINVKWKSVRPHSVCGGEEQPRFRDGPPPPPLVPQGPRIYRQDCILK